MENLIKLDSSIESNMRKTTVLKTLKVTEEAHRNLKILAASKGMTMSGAIMYLILEHGSPPGEEVK